MPPVVEDEPGQAGGAGIPAARAAQLQNAGIPGAARRGREPGVSRLDAELPARNLSRLAPRGLRRGLLLLPLRIFARCLAQRAPVEGGLRNRLVLSAEEIPPCRSRS